MNLKTWYSNAKILWGLILALSGGLLYFINLYRSYEPEICRLRLENMKQDSTIAFQEIEIKRLKLFENKDDAEFKNIYNLFFDYNLRIKSLEGIK